MITRPMRAPLSLPHLGHSEEPLQPVRYHSTNGPSAGYTAPIRRTASFAFAPRVLGPKTTVRGMPRPNG